MSLADRLQKAQQRDRISEVRARVQERLVEVLGPRLYDSTLSDTELEGLVHQRLRELLDEEEAPLSAQEKLLVVRQIGDSVLGLGPLEPFVRDPEVTEIMVNGWDTIYVERAGKLYWTGTKFHDEQQLRRTIDKIVAKVGRRVDEASPYVDARLPDGSRVNAIIPPLAIDGPSLTIRKFASDPYQAEDLVEFGTMTSPVSKFLECCVRGRINIMVSGGTGAGKTTTLNVLSSFIPDDERIITIEDAAELKLQQPHVVRLESRPPNIEGRGAVTIRDLVRNSLRMRPDRIVVGECRGSEALDMLQAMNTGHDGSISTIHSNSPRDSLSRLETITMMAGMELSPKSIREQVASAIQMIVHQQRLKDGTRRLTHVTEVAGMEGDVITLQDLFVFDFAAGVDDEGRFKGRLKSTGLRPKFLDKLAERGVQIDPEIFALEDRGEPAVIAESFWSTTTALALVVTLVFGACVGLGWLLLGSAARRKADREMAMRLRSSGQNASAAVEASAASGGWIPQSMSSFGRRFASAGGFGEALDMRLEAAGVSVRSGEFVVGSAAAALVGALVGVAVFKTWVFGVIFAAVAAVGPWFYLQFQLNSRADKMREQLPDVLTILASSLRAGHSFLQALDTVSKEIPEPAAGEFVRVVAEVRLGRPVEDALGALADRVGSEDFKWAVLAVNIQREVGGNLAEILDNVADTLRERAILRRQVRVLTTEGRLSAWVLGIMPFVIALYMYAVNKEYISLLVTTTAGWVLTIGAIGLLTLGVIWMRKIVKIDV